MGLAATQVRLLQLTSRQHRIEYQAQKIQAQKLQLSNESDRVYNEYMAALDAKKVQYKYVETDGTVSYKDATFNSMFGGYNKGVQIPYALEILNGENAGKFYVADDRMKDAYEAFENWEAVPLTDEELGTKYNVTIDDNNREEYQKKYMGEKFAAVYMQLMTVTEANSMTDTNFATALANADPAELDYYINLYAVLTESGPNGVTVFDTAHYGDDYEWLTNMLANGEVLLHKYDSEAGDDGKGAWMEVAVSTDNMLQEIADEKELKKAEAVYEAETSRINRKDTQYDTLLSQTETERNAIKTEMDSLKQVRNDNIDKTFKLFS